MSSERPSATRAEVNAAIREIRDYHAQGVQSLRELPNKGVYGTGAIEEQARRLGCNPTRLRKARQFAHRLLGYSPKSLDALCRLLREHRPVFGVSHVGLLVSIPWPQRMQLQLRCIDGNWSTAELQAEIRRLYGSRREGGRRRRVSRVPAEALVQLSKMADSWQRWFKVAREKEEGAASVLDGLPENVRALSLAVEVVVASLSAAVEGELGKVQEPLPAQRS